MRQSPTHAISQRDSRCPVAAHNATVAAPDAVGVLRDRACDIAIGIEQRARHRAVVDAAPVERARAACARARGWPTKPSRRRRRRRRRHRPATRGRARCANPRSRDGACRGRTRPRARGARRAPSASRPRIPSCVRGARAVALGRQRLAGRRLAGCHKAHGRHGFRERVSVHSGSPPLVRPRRIVSPACQRNCDPCGCVTPATVTPLSPWTTTFAPAFVELDDVDVVTRHVLVRPVDHQRLVARAADAKRQRLDGKRHACARPRPCAPRATNPLGRGRAATIGVAGVVGACTRGAIGVAGAPRSPAVRSRSRGYCDGSPRASPESTMRAPGTTSITVCPRRTCRRCASAAAEHALRRLDANAVRRPAVGHPPRALVEPDLAMPAARVLAVDDDVAALAVADRIAATRNDGRQRDMAAAVGVLDFHFQRSAGERRARSVEAAGLVLRAGRRAVELRPASLEADLVRSRRPGAARSSAAPPAIRRTLRRAPRRLRPARR